MHDEAQKKEIARLTDLYNAEKLEKKQLEAELAKRQQFCQQKFKELFAGAKEFDKWAEGLRDSTKKHLDQLQANAADLVSENNFMMNRMSGLIELEEKIRKKQGFSGLLVIENELEVLKNEVYVYTA